MPLRRRRNPANHEAANHHVDADCPGACAFDRFERERMKLAAPQPGAGLHFRQDEQWGKQRVRDIGSEIHLQSIEPQDLADDEYEKEMQTV
jgi:hypothetical protein